jgi:hypothetical protein
MGAPKGNEFWKLRSKHGRDKIFTSPEILWEAATEYFEATAARTWDTKDWVGKDANEVTRKVSPPFLLISLCIFLDIDMETWRLYRQRKEFIGVITRIENIIFTQKFEGASVGIYNNNIIARELGLVDKKEEIGGQKIKVTIKHDQ